MTMKIGGPKGPGSVVAPKPPEVKPDTEAREVAFERLLTPGPAEAAGRPDAGTIEALAARIRSGELSAGAAAQQLVDEVVRVRGAALDATGRQRLREHLQRLLDEDPLLVARLTRVGQTSER